MRKTKLLIATFTLMTLTGLFLHSDRTEAQLPSDGQIMFVLDASSSMLDKDGTATTRIAKAKTSLSKALSSIPKTTQVGLRVYGAKVPDTDKAAGCQDTQRLVAPAPDNADKIKTAVSGIQAKGWTLMGKSLQEVQNDFSGEGPKTVILISDGIDTCTPPNACDVAKRLSKNGVKIKVNTIGLLVDNSAKKQLQCIASGSGGKYYNVDDIKNLESVLSKLTAEEVSLFETRGLPIKGSLRVDEAPLMQPNLRYKDELTVPQELYYAFDIKRQQDISVTVTALSRPYGLFDYIRVDTYDADTGKRLLVSSSERFSSDTAVPVVDFNTDSFSYRNTKKVAIKVFISNKGEAADGDKIPLEIGFTATSKATGSLSKDKDGEGESITLSPLVVALITLGSVAVIALIGFIIYKVAKGKAEDQPPSNPQPPQYPTNNMQGPMT